MRSYLKISFLGLCGMAGLAGGIATGAEPAPLTPPSIPETVPCRIVEAVKPQFPIRMLREGVTHGRVHMLLHVDSTGVLGDMLVTAYSRKAFVEEALPAVRQWKFIPGQIKGEPVETIVDLAFTFEVNGVVVVQNLRGEIEPDGGKYDKYEYQAADVKQLDRVPTPLNIVEPTYPREWMKAGITGNVAVDFYIDETGKIRFPSVVPGANDRLAGIALAAVQQWRFVPPQAKGRPVLVRARQIFQFDAEETPSAGG